MSVDRVEVWLDEAGRPLVRVGVLSPSFQGGRNLASVSFQYDPDYLTRRDSYPISPDLPLRPNRQLSGESQALFGVFDDASPDDWGKKIIEANHARLFADDRSLPGRLGDFDYLIGVSDATRIGALRLRDPISDRWLSDDNGVENHHELERVVAAARRYEANEATDEDMDYLGDIATSPGGARPKANVITVAGRLGIAKLPHSKDGAIDVERWEALALELAERSGLRTAPSALYPTGDDKSVLVLERFDRTPDGDRIPYLSGNTALGIGAYDDRRGTYEEFADTIADLCYDPRRELAEMFARIVLTLLVNNVDDHWRNHGFLRDRDGWKLSPIFDINPSRLSSLRARPISSGDDPQHRDPAHLLNLASTFQLRPAEAAAIVERVTAEVEHWPEIAEELKIPSEQQRVMSAAFDPSLRERARTLIAPLLASAPRRVPRLGKGAALDQLGQLLGEHYELGRGSSIPSQLFTDAALRVGVSTVGTMPERAQRVVEAAGLHWDPTFDSRNSPSGGGSTVTLAGLQRLIEALSATAPES